MTRMQIQFAAALGLIFITLIIAGLLVADKRVISDPSMQDWQPAILKTETSTPTPTSGWWDEMPTPVPLVTSTPTIEPTDHE